MKKLLFALPILAILATSTVGHVRVASVTLNPSEQGISPVQSATNNPFIAQPTTEPVTNTPSEPQTDAVTEAIAPTQDVPPAPVVTPEPPFVSTRIASSPGSNPILGY